MAQTEILIELFQLSRGAIYKKNWWLKKVIDHALQFLAEFHATYWYCSILLIVFDILMVASRGQMLVVSGWKVLVAQDWPYLAR